MAAIKKAIRSSMRRKQYSMFEQKENDYIHTPEFNAGGDGGDKRAPKVREQANKTQTSAFRRGSQMTRSMKDAMGVIRQGSPTRCPQAPGRPQRPYDCESPTGLSRRFSLRKTRSVTPTKHQGNKEVPLYSPFHIETPNRSGRVARRNHIRTVVNMETPTRLRREVEALTANMQALATLSPNILHEQCRSKSAGKLVPLTNGSLKTPQASRRRIVTNV